MKLYVSLNLYLISWPSNIYNRRLVIISLSLGWPCDACSGQRWSTAPSPPPKQIDIAIQISRRRLFCFYILMFNDFMSFPATVVYKALNGLSPKYMQCMFTLNKNNHNLHSDNKICLPKCHMTNFGLKSFAYQAGRLWNNLPKSFRTCESLKDFKTKIVTWSIDMWYIHFTVHFSMFSICWFNLFQVLYLLLSLLVFKSNFIIIVLTFS